MLSVASDGDGDGHFGVVRGVQRDRKRVRIDVYLRILVRLSLSCSELRLDDRPREYILMTGDLDGEVVDDGGSGDGLDRIRFSVHQMISTILHTPRGNFCQTWFPSSNWCDTKDL